MKELKKEFVNKFFESYKYTQNGVIDFDSTSDLNFDLCCEDSESQQEEITETCP